jgi:hypothetical protein
VLAEEIQSMSVGAVEMPTALKVPLARRRERPVLLFHAALADAPNCSCFWTFWSCDAAI